MKQYITSSERETEALAACWAKSLCPGDVIAYRGGLGAGKTAFTRGLATGLGIDEDVSSPTFSLINEYHGGDVTLCHFDMYRISGLDGLYSTGFFDYLDGERILAIEWSENIASYLPEHTITVTLELDGETGRRITIRKGGAP